MTTQPGLNTPLVDVSDRVEEIHYHVPSSTARLRLTGEEGFQWILTTHPDTPIGYISIGGINNGSFRIIAKNAFYKLLKKAMQ